MPDGPGDGGDGAVSEPTHVPDPQQHPGTPGALVRANPLMAQTHLAQDGMIVVYVNGANGAFWFPMPPEYAIEFFEKGLSIARGAVSPLIVPSGLTLP